MRGPSGGAAYVRLPAMLGPYDGTAYVRPTAMRGPSGGAAYVRLPARRRTPVRARDRQCGARTPVSAVTTGSRAWLISSPMERKKVMGAP
ncbi:hypothetical protein GA0115253_110096 [Streptomyces sp. Termitarium-T10T-6]|nr:hypothetical protein GA0115253_110096 [Streptomyces sp. Termitarium-T10T-6]